MLDGIIDRAVPAFDLTGANYSEAALVPHCVGRQFSRTEAETLIKADAQYVKNADRELIENIFRFLRAAGRGAVFLARVPPKAFIAYWLEQLEEQNQGLPVR